MRIQQAYAALGLSVPWLTHRDTGEVVSVELDPNDPERLQAAGWKDKAKQCLAPLELIPYVDDAWDQNLKHLDIR